MNSTHQLLNASHLSVVLSCHCEKETQQPPHPTAQAVAQITADWAKARPHNLPFGPNAMAIPARTVPSKRLSPPIVRVVPRTQKTLSNLAYLEPETAVATATGL